MKKTYFAIFILSLMILSCKSAPEGDFKLSNLPGMIYDADNRPCGKVLISAWGDNKKGEEELLYIVTSDINGRFTIPKLDRGHYRITAEKENFESIELDFYYSSRLEVLYLKIFSQKQILNLATEALNERRFGKVEGYLERSGEVNPNDPYFLYLKAIFLYEKKNFSEALIPLEKIVEQGYKFPYVHLLIADIFEYELKQPENALIHLNEYINLIEDSEIILRIKELEEL